METTQVHVVTWPLQPTTKQARQLQHRFHAGTRFYNAILKETLTRADKLRKDPRWATTAQQAPSPERTRTFRNLKKEHGVDEYSLHRHIPHIRKSWLVDALSSDEAQVLATRAAKTVDRYLTKQSGRPRYKPVRRGLNALVSKRPRSGVRPIFTHKTHGDLIGLEAKVTGLIKFTPVAKGNGRAAKDYQTQWLWLTTKLEAGDLRYPQIVRKTIKGKTRYYAQFVLAGPAPTRFHPPTKDTTAVASIDFGPTYAAVALRNKDTWETERFEIGSDLNGVTATPIEKQVRKLSRKLDRQHRAGSPDCFRENGTHKPGCKWQKSKQAQHTQNQLQELHRRATAHRITNHRRIANTLLNHANDIRVEKVHYKNWAKTYPKATATHGAGTLATIIAHKAESASIPYEEFSTITTALSQTCVCGTRKKKTLSQRTHHCTTCGLTTHRDTLSAYLGTHVTTHTHNNKTTTNLSLEQAKNHWNKQTPNTGKFTRGGTPADRSSSPNKATKRRGQRTPTKRSMARIAARRNTTETLDLKPDNAQAHSYATPKSDADTAHRTIGPQTTPPKNLA